MQSDGRLCRVCRKLYIILLLRDVFDKVMILFACVDDALSYSFSILCMYLQPCGHVGSIIDNDDHDDNNDDDDVAVGGGGGDDVVDDDDVLWR